MNRKEGLRKRILAGGAEVGAWTFTVIPDLPPTIALSKPPETTPRGSMKLTYKAEDDYGVAFSMAVPLDDRFTAVAQAAYNKRTASISNFAYEAFTTLAGISWRF